MTKALLSVLAFLVVGAFIALGFWQYGKSEEKAKLQQANERMNALAEASTSNDEMPWQNAKSIPSQALPVSTYVRMKAWGKLFAVDNQQVDGRVGVVWYQDAETEDGTRILVELGFMAYQQGRTLSVPKKAHISDAFNVVLKPWPGQGMALGNNTPQQMDQGFSLFNQLRVNDVSTWLQADVLSDRLLVPPQSWQIKQHVALRPVTTKIFEDMPPERHLAYAFQWFAMAAAVAIIWLIMMIRSRKKYHGVSI